MSYSTTTPRPGDTEVVLLKKLLQLFGGSSIGPDSRPQLLADILAAASSGGASVSKTVEFILALTGNGELVSADAGAEEFRAPYAFTITGVRASLAVASTSGAVTVDINKNGSSILSTKLTIDQNEKTSRTAATPAVISDTSVADDDYFTFDIDGGGTNAQGLKVTIIGTIG